MIDRIHFAIEEEALYLFQKKAVYWSLQFPVHMKVFFSVLLFSLCSQFSFSQVNPWENELIAFFEKEIEVIVLGDLAIKSAKWDELQHPRFWQKIMVLSPDSVLVNVANTRQIVGRLSNRQWSSKTEGQKSVFKDSIRSKYQLSSSDRINVTTGKSDFYRFDLVFESLPRGIACFEESGVDPWFAQSILLIESPGQLAKSSVGAYCPFQLMPGVARAMGLTVNKTVDERKNFNRSAFAAAQLLKRSCIPSARSIAHSAGLSIDEQSIWFRLLVMHVYHAGAMNVKVVVSEIGKVETGEELIQKMWITSAASFGNASQNYSQLALAAHLQLAEIIAKKSCLIYQCGSANL